MQVVRNFWMVVLLVSALISVSIGMVSQAHGDALSKQTSGNGAVPLVATTIRPIHSLTAAIMQGVGEPYLIMDQAQSEHEVALRPSQMRVLQDAYLVIWIGPGIEQQLTRTFSRLGTTGTGEKVLSLADIAGINWLPLNHDAHDAHDEHDAHDAHDGHHAHDDGRDWHIWLDADNAVVMAEGITRRLVEMDPDNAEIYAANRDGLIADIRRIDVELAQSISGGKYVASHDAFAYFANRYGWHPLDALSRGHDMTPSVADVVRVSTQVKDGLVGCLIADRTSDIRSLDLVRGDTDVPQVTLDALGLALEPGPALYGELLGTLGAAFISCTK